MTSYVSALVGAALGRFGLRSDITSQEAPCAAKMAKLEEKLGEMEKQLADVIRERNAANERVAKLENRLWQQERGLAEQEGRLNERREAMEATERAIAASLVAAESRINNTISQNASNDATNVKEIRKQVEELEKGFDKIKKTDIKNFEMRINALEAPITPLIVVEPPTDPGTNPPIGYFSRAWNDVKRRWRAFANFHVQHPAFTFVVLTFALELAKFFVELWKFGTFTDGVVPFSKLAGNQTQSD